MIPFPDGTVFFVLDADVLSKFTILVGLYGNVCIRYEGKTSYFKRHV